MNQLHITAAATVGLWLFLWILAEWPLFYTPPKPGEVWRFRKKEADPWDTEPGHLVTVLDVRSGWVRYDMGGSIFRNERRRMKVFLYCYSKAEPIAGPSTKSDAK